MNYIAGAEYAAGAAGAWNRRGIRYDREKEAPWISREESQEPYSERVQSKTEPVKTTDYVGLWEAGRRSRQNMEPDMETFKREFYQDLAKITKNYTVANAAVNISEEAFSAMKEDPDYREKVLSLIRRDLGASYAPRQCSVLIRVGGSLEEYGGDSWPVGYDSEFYVRSRKCNYRTDQTADYYDRLTERRERQEDYLEEYQEYLRRRYGNVLVRNVGSDQKSMDRLGAETAGMGNVVIAPNILQEMAEDPEKAAYYEGKIQAYYDSLPRMKAELSMMGHEIHSSGVVIHKDGTVTYYVSGDLKPEVRARIEARMKEEAEEKAKRRKYYMKLGEEAAQRRRDERMRMESIPNNIGNIGRSDGR